MYTWNALLVLLKYAQKKCNNKWHTDKIRKSKNYKNNVRKICFAIWDQAEKIKSFIILASFTADVDRSIKLETNLKLKSRSSS